MFTPTPGSTSAPTDGVTTTLRRTLVGETISALVMLPSVSLSSSPPGEGSAALGEIVAVPTPTVGVRGNFLIRVQVLSLEFLEERSDDLKTYHTIVQHVMEHAPFLGNESADMPKKQA